MAAALPKKPIAKRDANTAAALLLRGVTGSCRSPSGPQARRGRTSCAEHATRRAYPSRARSTRAGPLNAHERMPGPRLWAEAGMAREGDGGAREHHDSLVVHSPPLCRPRCGGRPPPRDSATTGGPERSADPMTRRGSLAERIDQHDTRRDGREDGPRSAESLELWHVILTNPAGCSGPPATCVATTTIAAEDASGEKRPLTLSGPAFRPCAAWRPARGPIRGVRRTAARLRCVVGRETREPDPAPALVPPDARKDGPPTLVALAGCRCDAPDHHGRRAGL